MPTADHPPQPALLEREAEIAAIHGLVAAARGGAGRLLVIEGRSGLGKTRLVGEVRGAARAGGFEVLAARAGELEQEFAFGMVRQLFEPLLARASAAERAELTAGAAGLARVRHNSGCLEVPSALERRSAGRHLFASVELPRDANSAGLAGT